jgi:hypothetical protein
VQLLPIPDAPESKAVAVAFPPLRQDQNTKARRARAEAFATEATSGDNLANLLHELMNPPADPLPESKSGWRRLAKDLVLCCAGEASYRLAGKSPSHAVNAISTMADRLRVPWEKLRNVGIDSVMTPELAEELKKRAGRNNTVVRLKLIGGEELVGHLYEIIRDRGLNAWYLKVSPKSSSLYNRDMQRIHVGRINELEVISAPK